MDILRNPEVRKSLSLHIVLTVISCLGFFIGIYYGLLALTVCLVFDAVHFTSLRTRYKKISGLSMEIDRILHGNEPLDFNAYREGELAILGSEIYKMTVRMREQADALQNDKTYLVDSIADISHQIRTPLTSVNLIISLLQDPDMVEQRRLDLMQEMVRLLSRVDWLISSLLKMSKIDAGTAGLQSETVSVAELIRRASEPIAIPMELRNQQLFVNIIGDVTYTGDLAWSVEAVGNILKNCMEHTPSGGAVEVSASENAMYTEIVIRDNGCGIDKADLPYLFERFYRGRDAADQSVGIGLALSRMIVVEQNGTIKAENGKDGGAVFIVRFYKSIV
jgi:signal transduction histidine kinase